MTLETLKKYEGINDVVKQTKNIKGVGSWLPLYINFDEQRVKTQEENDGDFLLTHLIRPCKKAEVMETIIHMLSM